MLARPDAHPASYRDPDGRVFTQAGRILRWVSPTAAPSIQALLRSNLFAGLVERGWLVDASPVEAPDDGQGPGIWLEHPRLTTISYPYEWPFRLLKRAALLHLDLHLATMDAGFTLTDASAYNVQFQRGRPTFIDITSFRLYQPGQAWTGHRQFCEQFLYPLLLTARWGMSHQPWYRGALEGLEASQLRGLLSLRDWLSPRMLAHVLLPLRGQSVADSMSDADLRRRVATRIGLRQVRNVLLDLRYWIGDLEPSWATDTPWAEYSTSNTYTDEAERQKAQFVEQHMRRWTPSLVIDLGCNDGRYCRAAIDGGASEAVGVDLDQMALDRAVRLAAHRGEPILPLYMDLTNPSPDQGWRQRERTGLAGRFDAGAVQALAVLHHLVVQRNMELGSALASITSLAPRGIVEFVPLGDPTVQRMLATRQSGPRELTLEAVLSVLNRSHRVVSEARMPGSERVLLAYEPSQQQ